jgi:aconitate hydratase
VITAENAFSAGSYIFFPGIRGVITQKTDTIAGYVLGDTVTPIQATLGELTGSERQILLDGCLINYYRR